MEKKIEFKIGGETLRGSMFVPQGKGSFPAVVFYHGRGSTRKRYLPMCKRLAEKGIIGLAFDFRGCGESDGEFENQTQAMGVEDAKAGLEFLLSQNVDKNRIGIEGTSFGGFVTGMLLNDYDFIKSVVFRVPAVYPNGVLDTHVKSIADLNKINREEWLRSLAYEGISKFKGNLLIIQAENDEVVEDWVVQNYHNQATKAQKNELIIQKGATHSLHDSPKLVEEFYDLTVDWFLETL